MSARPAERPPRSPARRAPMKASLRAHVREHRHGRGADLGEEVAAAAEPPRGRASASPVGKRREQSLELGPQPRDRRAHAGDEPPFGELVEQRHPRHVAALDAGRVDLERSHGARRRARPRPRAAPAPPSRRPACRARVTSDCRPGAHLDPRRALRRAHDANSIAGRPAGAPMICSDTRRPIRTAG